MITIKEIKKDLKEIRRYYGNTAIFEGNVEIIEKVQKYNYLNTIVCIFGLFLFKKQKKEIPMIRDLFIFHLNIFK